MKKHIDLECKKRKSDLSFVKIPRWVFDLLYSRDAFEQQCGEVYLALIVKSYFSRGTAVRGKSAYCCERGEWIGSAKALSTLLRIPYSSFLRILDALKDSCLVDISRIKNGTRFRVIGYDEIVAGKKQVSRETICKELTPAEALWEYERQLGGRNLEFDLETEN